MSENKYKQQVTVVLLNGKPPLWKQIAVTGTSVGFTHLTMRSFQLLGRFKSLFKFRFKSLFELEIFSSRQIETAASIKNKEIRLT